MISAENITEMMDYKITSQYVYMNHDADITTEDHTEFTQVFSCGFHLQTVNKVYLNKQLPCSFHQVLKLIRHWILSGTMLYMY